MLGVERLRHVLYRICVPALLLAGLMLPEVEGTVAIEPQLSRTGQVHGGPTTNKRKAADVEWNEENELARKCASISCIDGIAPDLASASKGKGAGAVHNRAHDDINRGSFDDRMHRGTISVPNGQGMRYVDESGEELPTGVYVNELTSTKHVDKFIGTPLHKFVPARVSLVA